MPGAVFHVAYTDAWSSTADTFTGFSQKANERQDGMQIKSELLNEKAVDDSYGKKAKLCAIFSVQSGTSSRPKRT